MNAGFRLKVWAIRLFGVLLALAGALLVVQLVALLLWQYGIALETRAWPRLPIRLLFADHSELAAKSIAPILQFIPEIRWSWIRDPQNPSALYPVAAWLFDRVHIGVVPALLGALLALRGVLLVMRHKYALVAAKQQDGDRLRRIHEYRRQQRPDPGAEREIAGAPPDLDLIEAAEKAWRQERLKVLR